MASCYNNAETVHCFFLFSMLRERYQKITTPQFCSSAYQWSLRLYGSYSLGVTSALGVNDQGVTYARESVICISDNGSEISVTNNYIAGLQSADLALFPVQLDKFKYAREQQLIRMC